jgi:hypothetical protein
MITSLGFDLAPVSAARVRKKLERGGTVLRSSYRKNKGRGMLKEYMQTICRILIFA